MLEQEEDNAEQPSASWALPTGCLLDRGRYRIVRLLGHGGMGAVYEAEHTLTQKRVAIKSIHPMQASPSATERLVREARAAARVRHSNAVDVYDVVQDDGTVFLVMELLRGEPLSAWLARGDKPMHRAIALLLPAMRAVAAAHKQGVVHRDIKPDNIFLSEEDGAPDVIPKVVDFGISKVHAPDLMQPSLTRTGGAIGTPRYMSYEQLAGEADIDGRADVYAFGVILYQILTGRLPFEAPSFPALVAKVVTSVPIDPKELCPEIPSVLGRIVLWALARQRDERIASMEELIRELEPFATSHGFRAEMTLPGDEVPDVPSEPPQHSELRRRMRLRASTTCPELPLPPSESPVSRRARGPLVMTVIVVAALGALVLKLLTSGADKARQDSQMPRSSTMQTVPHGPGPAALPAQLPSTPPPATSLTVDAGAPSEARSPGSLEGPPTKSRPAVKPKGSVAGPASAPTRSKRSAAPTSPKPPEREESASEAIRPDPPKGAAAHKKEGFRVPAMPLSEQF